MTELEALQLEKLKREKARRSISGKSRAEKIQSELDQEKADKLTSDLENKQMMVLSPDTYALKKVQEFEQPIVDTFQKIAYSGLRLLADPETAVGQTQIKSSAGFMGGGLAATPPAKDIQEQAATAIAEQGRPSTIAIGVGLGKLGSSESAAVNARNVYLKSLKKPSYVEKYTIPQAHLDYMEKVNNFDSDINKLANEKGYSGKSLEIKNIKKNGVTKIQEKVKELSDFSGVSPEQSVSDKYALGRAELKYNAEKATDNMLNSSNNKINLDKTANYIKDYMSENGINRKTTVQDYDRAIIKAYDTLKANKNILSKQQYLDWKRSFGKIFDKMPSYGSRTIWDYSFDDFVRSGYSEELTAKHRDLWKSNYRAEYLSDISKISNPKTVTLSGDSESRTALNDLSKILEDKLGRKFNANEDIIDISTNKLIQDLYKSGIEEIPNDISKLVGSSDPGEIYNSTKNIKSKLGEERASKLIEEVELFKSMNSPEVKSGYLKRTMRNMALKFLVGGRTLVR